MNVTFFEMGANPRPPEEVRIEQLNIYPHPDRKRVMISMVITPFTEKPNLELEMRNANGDLVASTAVLEASSSKLEPTLHVRGEQTDRYTVTVHLYYEQNPPQQTMEQSFSMDEEIAKYDED